MQFPLPRSSHFEPLHKHFDKLFLVQPRTSYASHYHTYRTELPEFDLSGGFSRRRLNLFPILPIYQTGSRNDPAHASESRSAGAELRSDRAYRVTPDTVIMLTTGQIIRVLESADEVVSRVVDFRRSIYRDLFRLSDRRRSLPASQRAPARPRRR